jgi:trans-aconitate methyltransferase
MTAVGAAFSAHAADYDRVRRALVPPFDDFYGTVVDLVELWRPPGPYRFLDLGAGTGLLAARLLARFPDLKGHLIDLAAPMLDQARDRLGGGLVSFEVADYSTSPLAGPWDLIVSALSIHHLEDGRKKDLFARILGALCPGGLFVNAEQVSSTTALWAGREDERWRREAARLGASPADITAALNRMELDRCATLEAQLAWLREAGFSEVDCAFKHWRFAVYHGSRPAA